MSPDRSDTVPWAPEDLDVSIDELRSGWSYIVLEEIVDQYALLRRWPWPLVDRWGRLVWRGDSEHDTVSATVEVNMLREQLYRPNELERRPRVGDVYAAEHRSASRWTRRSPVSDVRELFDARVYDVSADAREAAKIAYQSSLGAVHRAAEQDNAVTALVAGDLEVRPRLRPLLIAPPPETDATNRIGQ